MSRCWPLVTALSLFFPKVFSGQKPILLSCMCGIEDVFRDQYHPSNNASNFYLHITLAFIKCSPIHSLSHVVTIVLVTSTYQGCVMVLLLRYFQGFI